LGYFWLFVNHKKVSFIAHDIPELRKDRSLRREKLKAAFDGADGRRKKHSEQFFCPT
jgi:hypothetical protein